MSATQAPAPVLAAPASHRGGAARPDALDDLRALAQQRPWTCREPGTVQVRSAWPNGKAECAWQNRLRKHSWSWSDGAPSSCISRQARWWNWAQAGLPPAALRSVWDRRWSTQTLRFAVGGEERLLLLARGGDDQWHATEWRWNPNPRPATRRWQERRWKVLVESAARHQPPASAVQPEATPAQPVFRRVLGARPGELGPAGLALEAAGLCLTVGNPLPGQARLPLSYSPNDSRLEQRAAMHLQLSRQHPDAKWLTPFKMLDMPANLPSGAKFLATWVEGTALNSQLWMPSKNNAATVRLRASIRLPRGPDNPATLWQARQAVERELGAIAVQWAAAYE
ncbi:MAG: hypothetical protein ABWY02_12865 [Telluria sp.]